MAFLEDMHKRAKKFGLIDVKLAQGAAMFLALNCSQANTSNNGFKYLVVRRITNNMCDETGVRVFAKGIIFFLLALVYVSERIKYLRALSSEL